MPKTARLAKPRPDDPLAEILESWRFWLLSAALGAVLAWTLYQVAPPPYRAQATVVVDANLEEAWIYFPDRQLFQFLARETERLEELAWSDGVMQIVYQQTDIPVSDLRSNVLQLSQPSDGGWHFYAQDPNAVAAQAAASAWVTAFADAVHAAVEVSPELEAARAALGDALQAGESDEGHLNELMQEISAQHERTKGISPFTEVALSQADELPVERTVGQATYLLAGSVVGALVAPLWALLRPASKRR